MTTIHWLTRTGLIGPKCEERVMLTDALLKQISTAAVTSTPEQVRAALLDGKEFYTPANMYQLVEPEDGPQKLYRVTVRRDAWVNYTADIKATSPEEAAAIATQAWKTGEPEIKFDEDGLQEFDHIECNADDDVEEITDQDEDAPATTYRFAAFSQGGSSPRVCLRIPTDRVEEATAILDSYVTHDSTRPDCWWTWTQDEPEISTDWAARATVGL